MDRKHIAILALVISVPAHAAAAGAVMMMHLWHKEKIVQPEPVRVDHVGHLYDCRIAEISPDIPNKVRALCRKKIAEMRKTR